MAIVGGTTSVIGGGKFSNGAMGSAFQYLFNDFVVFNGKSLQWYDDDQELVQEWRAVSGKPGSMSNDMSIGDFGPIPEGTWLADPAKSNYDAFWKIGWGSSDSWGSVRTLLQPVNGTITYGRSGMYLHGGTNPGSIGCIDLTYHNDSFHQKLQTYGKPIKVYVGYNR